MFNGNFKLHVYNRTLGLSPQTLSSSSLPISMRCAPIHLPSQATIWPESWPPLIWTSWMTFYMAFLLLSCSDPFSAYMAVKETSPPALKPFSSWFPCELGRKPQSLKGLTGSAWPRPCLHLRASFTLLVCSPAIFHLRFYVFLKIPPGAQCFSLCHAHLSPGSSSDEFFILRPETHPSGLRIKSLLIEEASLNP